MAKKKTAKKVAKPAAKKAAKKVIKKVVAKKVADSDAEQSTETAATKKKVTKKKAVKRKKKSTEPTRYRLIWGVYSSSMREEARFDYAQRKDADKKAEQLKAKGKKLYWVQPIKEVIIPEPEVDDE